MGNSSITQWVQVTICVDKPFITHKTRLDRYRLPNYVFDPGAYLTSQTLRYILGWWLESRLVLGWILQNFPIFYTIQASLWVILALRDFSLSKSGVWFNTPLLWLWCRTQQKKVRYTPRDERGSAVDRSSGNAVMELLVYTIDLTTDIQQQALVFKWTVQISSLKASGGLNGGPTVTILFHINRIWELFFPLKWH